VSIGMWYNYTCLGGGKGVLLCATDHNPIDCGQSALHETINVLLHLDSGGKHSRGGRFAMLTNEDWAYWAGFLDGDGCISIIKPRKSVPRLTIVFTQVTSQILQMGYSETGLGHIYKQDQRWRLDRAVYKWHLYEKDAEFMLGKILPYLKAKRDQGQIANQFMILKRKGVKQGKTTSMSTKGVLLEYADMLSITKKKNQHWQPVGTPLVGS